MIALRWSILFALAGLATAPFGPALAQEGSFQWSGDMAPGRVLEVTGIAGQIHAVRAQGSEASVVATKRGDVADFPEVAVEVVELEDRVVICTIYGSWNHGEGHCDPRRRREREEGRERHRRNDIDVKVDFEVHVPDGVTFEANMVSGDIQAEGLRSDVSANTVSGRVRVGTSGRVQANTVNGDLELSMGDPGEGDLSFHTVSGDITLWLPRDASARIDFQSLSGNLTSDFDLSLKRETGRWVGSHVEAVLGRGGRALSVQTVSGDLRLKRLPG